MIVKMMKYSFILHHNDYEGFLDSLQELGMVDVTISDWEATDSERALLQRIERHRAAMDALKTIEGAGVPFKNAEEAFNNYLTASSDITRLNATLAKSLKERDELRVWGEFDPAKIAALAKEGIKLQFFSVFTKDYGSRIGDWIDEYALEKISEINGVVYFVIATRDDSPAIQIDAMEVRTPEMTYTTKIKEIETIESEIEESKRVLARCALSIESLAGYGESLRSNLHISKVKTTSRREADGTLVLMEGWATEETQVKVDEFVGASPVVCIKETPSDDDEPPVLLKNNKFAQLFEVIGGFYALPKYGTLDLTPYFAPFYMMFFGFCLADAGYGLLYVIGAIVAIKKLPEKLKKFGWLILCCGISTVFFGLLTGNMFGIELAKQPMLEGLSKYVISSNMLFSLALVLGMIQILFGMAIKAIFTARMKGFVYGCSTFGWMIVIISGLAAFALPNFGITSYNTSSPVFWAVTGLGLFGMLFLNSPGKNPFVNFGMGLWNTYNDITGLLSDALSYIRLFALGLSGGILALVFNKLAAGMSPDIIIVKQIVMILILAVGQGLTLFMASLSAFVHPLRLTFVEFYKNAGFEPGGRAFDPLKKNNE